MRKIAMFVLMTLSLGALSFGLKTAVVSNAQAGPTSAIATVGPQSFPPSLVQKAACGGVWGHHCRPGLHWVCGPRRCWCAPC